MRFLHQTGAEGNGVWTVDVDGENATEIVKEVDLPLRMALSGRRTEAIAVILFDWQLDEKGKKVLRDPGRRTFVLRSWTLTA